MSIPLNVTYQQIPPLGFPTNMMINRFQPQGNLNQFSVNDAIRFIVNAKNSYWDPYSCYIQVDVDFDEMEEDATLQLDHSAHSLIRTMIIKNGQTELERIEEYDTISQILLDMSYSVERRASVLNQGTGFKNAGISKHGQLKKKQLILVDNKVNEGPIQLNNASVEKRYGTGIVGENSFKPKMTWEYNPQNANSEEFFGPSNIEGAGNPNETSNRTSSILQKDYEQGEDFQIGDDVDGFDYIEKGFTFMSDSCSQPIQDSKSQRIEKTLVENTFILSPGQRTEQGQMDIDYSYAFCGTSFEPTYGPSLQNVIVNGKPSKQQVRKASYTIPLLSGLLGVLMPKKSYKLIPMNCLRDLIIEFQLNQYAFFSSGYPQQENDTDDFQGVSPFKRNGWKISRIEIVCEMIQFDQVTEAALMATQQAGIVLHTCSWLKACTYSFPAGQSPQGTYSINQGFESLRSLVFTIHPLDYQMYDFCRKSYRISQCIKYMQLKVALKYYPSLAVQGNGSNNCINKFDPVSLNNSEFLINLDKSFGRYVDVLGDKYINTANFALNDRSYDPTNKTQWKDEQGKIVNFDTANGAPMFYENQCQGKAVYALDLESLSFDPNSISGLNTTQSIPFELILKSDGNHSFARRSEMHIFSFYDMLVKLQYNQNASVMGRT